MKIGHPFVIFLIHNNELLSNVQKLQYLKSNIEGDADSLLKSTTITEDNYAEAWKKFTDRYEHKRYIVDCLLSNFLNQPRVQHENHKDIKTLIDKSSEIIQGLRLQGVPVAQWDVIIVHIIVSKLDPETHKQWELKQKKDELATFANLQAFLESRWQSLEMIQQSHSNDHIQDNSKNGNKDNTSSYKFSDKNRSSSKVKCFLCSEIDHKLNKCPKYNKLSVDKRTQFIKVNKLCFNCLSNGHASFNCISQSGCRDSSSKHHTSIHTENKIGSSSSPRINQQKSNASDSTIIKRSNTTVSTTKDSEKRVLLATAIVYILNGDTIPVKALIDQGSENNVILESLIKKLHLTKTLDLSSILGVGETPVETGNSAVNIRITSCIDNTFSLEL